MCCYRPSAARDSWSPASAGPQVRLNADTPPPPDFAASARSKRSARRRDDAEECEDTDDTTSTASAGPKPKDAHAVDAPSRRDPGSGSVAAVPGSRRLRRCRRPAAPGTLEPDRERGLEDRHPRTRLELSGRLGRPDLRHVRDPAGRAGETAHRHGRSGSIRRPEHLPRHRGPTTAGSSRSARTASPS